MGTIKTALITGYGINAQEELKQAFDSCGAQTEYIHINDLISSPDVLGEYRILGFPGGFSFGDHLGSGLVFAHLCRGHLFERFTRFIEEGNLVLGICNGFQVLVKMGLLPNAGGRGEQEVSLVHNESGVFEDSWVHVTFPSESNCVWTKELPDMELPIRHGEGRFITASSDIADKLRERKLVAVRYNGRNPNGSERDIAGITDTTGRVLGLMPHPEAYLVPENHPQWPRHPEGQEPTSLMLFRNGIDYLKNS